MSSLSGSLRKIAARQKREKFLDELRRPDGRPEVYDVAEHMGGANMGYVCMACQNEGHHNRRYQTGEIFMSSPVDTGEPALFCKEHIPDNAVILNPFTGECRDKKGENVWREGNDKPVAKDVIQ